MTVQEFYAEIKGNYDEIISRMRKEDRVKKFVFMFLEDESFIGLCDSMEAGNYQDAFRQAHTLKGLCQNLAFSDLYKPVYELTECLRDGACDEKALGYFEQTKQKYEFLVNTIEILQSAK